MDLGFFLKARCQKIGLRSRGTSPGGEAILAKGRRRAKVGQVPHKIYCDPTIVDHCMSGGPGPRREVGGAAVPRMEDARDLFGRSGTPLAEPP